MKKIFAITILSVFLGLAGCKKDSEFLNVRPLASFPPTRCFQITIRSYLTSVISITGRSTLPLLSTVGKVLQTLVKQFQLRRAVRW